MLAPFGRLFFSFRGRLPRHSFFWAACAVALAFIVLLVFFETVGGRNASLLLYPFLAWSSLALAARRLRDAGTSPWWLLAAVVPVLGPACLAYALFLRAGTLGDNQYGQDPLLVGRDYLTVKF